MDDADFSDERQQKLLDASIENIQAKAGNIVYKQGSGICLECGMMVKPYWLENEFHINPWCSKVCRENWERGESGR